jgi:hypothetical protein
MEITKLNRNNCEVNVIFTGEQYIFHNAFYGILAVGQRKGHKKEDTNHFTIYYGNHQTEGGSFAGTYCLKMAKSFIKKNESKYVKVNTIFEEVQEDLDMWWMDFQAKRR